MWCSSCQQDVPGITTGVLPRPKCARCGKPFPSGGASQPHASFGGFLESGVDLMRIAAAQATSVAMAPPIDWEIRDRLREIGALLSQPAPPRPRLHRDGLFEAPLGDVAADAAVGNAVVRAVAADTGGDAAAAEPGEQSSSFFWTAVAVMLAFLLGLGLIWPELFQLVADRLR